MISSAQLGEMCIRAMRGEKFTHEELENLSVVQLKALALSWPPPSDAERQRRAQRAKAILDVLDAQSEE